MLSIVNDRTSRLLISRFYVSNLVILIFLIFRIFDFRILRLRNDRDLDAARTGWLSL
jgi:hypothetical protein